MDGESLGEIIHGLATKGKLLRLGLKDEMECSSSGSVP
jgi:hypothetical protein